MSFVDKLDRKYGRYVPENLTKILLIGQIAGFLLIYVRPDYLAYFSLTGKQLLAGEVWRLITFLFAPVSLSLLFLFLALYFYYILGVALESRWGSFRYLFYIAVSYLATIVFALLFPVTPVTNIYLFTSLFLAFTHIYPEFQVLLFFIIPMKVKWLGYLAWFGILLAFLSGTVPAKIFIIFSLSNYFFFFWKDLWYSVRSFNRNGYTSPKQVLIKEKPLHVCAVCGVNEQTDRNMEIRYCSQCVPTTCYCGEHISRHQHKRVVN